MHTHFAVTDNLTSTAQAAAIIAAYFPSAAITVTRSNNYEYAGINQVWQLGQKSLEGVVLYFHAKGVTHGPRAPQRLFDVVVRDWQRVLGIFQCFGHIDVVGHSIGSGGWAWFNFWWARLSYIRTVSRPVRVPPGGRRHYYEDWLGRSDVCKRFTPLRWTAGAVLAGRVTVPCIWQPKCKPLRCARLLRTFALTFNESGLASDPPRAVAQLDEPIWFERPQATAAEAREFLSNHSMQQRMEELAHALANATYPVGISGAELVKVNGNSLQIRLSLFGKQKRPAGQVAAVSVVVFLYLLLRFGVYVRRLE